jgi:hypothetical protein
MIKTITKEQQEAVDRLAHYIKNHVGSQDWKDHIYNCSAYVAVALGMDEQILVNAVRIKLGLGKEI